MLYPRKMLVSITIYTRYIFMYLRGVPSSYQFLDPDPQKALLTWKRQKRLWKITNSSRDTISGVQAVEFSGRGAKVSLFQQFRKCQVFWLAIHSPSVCVPWNHSKLSLVISKKWYEPPSKSIVDAWYENIGHRFFGGAYRFTVFCSNQH